MKNINDPMGLLESILESIDQHAAGPELKDAKELENKATEEKEPVELASDADNKDVYPTDEHKQEEDIDAVVVESEQVAAGPELEVGKELENEATEEKAAEPEAKELDNKDVFSSDEHEEAEDSDGVVVESEQVAAGPELKDAKELENEATEENKVEVSAEEVDNKDVFPSDEHKETEDIKEVVVEGKINEAELETNPVVKDAEDAGVASDEKAEDGKDMEDEDKAEESKDEDEAVAKEDKADEDKDEDEKEDSEDMNESMNAVFALLDKINESVQNAAGPELKDAKELENEATEEKAPEAVASDADNKDVYPTDEHEQKEEVEGVVVESEQVAAGPELETGKELENEATEEKDPVVAEPDTENKDVYCDVCHKQVEDVVEVVIEAASRCKSNGIKATKENIIKEAKQLLEAEEVALKVEKPAEKEYDVDASIESAEMNGNDEKFESYDDIQGDGSEAAKDEEAEVKPEDIQESVSYKSLREACLLDEGYFMTDSYIKETADEKQTKLTEQVSLLMARDAMDPIYDELLRESIHCMRLQEALVKKYGSEAAKRADMIINK